MGMRYGQWKLASMYLSHKDFRQGAYGPANMPEVEVNEKSVKGILHLYYADYTDQ